MNEFILNFIFNPWNSELSWKNLKKRLEKGEIEAIINGITVPVYLAIHGADVSWLEAAGFDYLIDLIRKNECIRIPATTYHHIYPGTFPEQIGDQLKWGRKILEHHFGRNKVDVNFGFLPDYTYHSGLAPVMREAGFNGVLSANYGNVFKLKETKVGIAREAMVEDRNVFFDHDGCFQIFATDIGEAYYGRQKGIKAAYHEYFRLFNSTNEVWEQFFGASEHHQGLGVFGIDLESYINNAPQLQGPLSGCQRFLELMEAFKESSSRLKFVHLETSRKLSEIKIPKGTLFQERNVPSKWHHSDKMYEEIFTRLSSTVIRRKEDLLFLHALTGSDFPSAFTWESVRGGKPAELPVRGHKPTVWYGDVTNRREALQAICSWLDGKPYDFKSPEAEWFMTAYREGMMHDADILFY